MALRMRLGVADPACLARLRRTAPIVVRPGLTTARKSQILARLRLRAVFKSWCDCAKLAPQSHQEVRPSRARLRAVSLSRMSGPT